MLTDSKEVNKYNLGKDLTKSVANTVASNMMPGESGNVETPTKRVISAGTVIITDEKGQLEKTGKTVEETLTTLYRDTDNVHQAIENNKIVHPTEKTASQTPKCKDFKCYMVQSAMREEELQRERDDISAGSYGGAAYSIYEMAKGLGYMVLYPVETADGIIYMIINPKATGEMIKQDYKGRAITIAQGVNQQTPTGIMKAGFEVGRMEGDVGGIIGVDTTLPKIGSKTLGYANKIIASSKKSAITTLAETSPAVRSTVAANVAESQTARAGSNFREYAKIEGKLYEDIGI